MSSDVLGDEPETSAASAAATVPRSAGGLDPADGCELCEAARITPWHFEDDTCWVADCEVCDVPMVVWKRHGDQPDDGVVEHMLACLAEVADRKLGPGVWSFDRVMRQIPDHFHAHARDPEWWLRRFGRR